VMVAVPETRHNVLMIIVDDLRPQVNAYGVPWMQTPNIDKLAGSGVLFENAYVQQAICSPTRNSFLSGRVPDKTKTWNFINDFREVGVGDKWTALPEFFRKQGYWTTGAGKIYHPGHPPNFDQNRSWSEKWPGDFGGCDCGGTHKPWPPGGQATCEGLDPKGLVCSDDKITKLVVGQIEQAAAGALGDGTQPWFIAAGLHKPHMPFYAPPQYFKMYPAPPPPTNPLPPTDMPYVAWHSCLSRAPPGDSPAMPALLNSSNFSDWGNFTDIPNSMTLDSPMPAATAARLRRGYSASVSYTDANVGLILDALEAGGLANDTLVLFMGDHGWSLGEQVPCAVTCAVTVTVTSPP
jgi:iduronate 2-sulfatase